MKALYINCSLKPGAEPSHTEALMRESLDILHGEGVETEMIRFADLDIRATVDPDEKGDDWPALYRKILDSRILVIGSPIWIGNMSSLATKLLERIYAHSGERNAAGQYIFYGRVGGCVVTGNEDGGKHVSRDLLFALQHVGFTVPPQADPYWVGEAGPGPSYRDAGRGNAFTQRNVRIMSWNLVHFARLLEAQGGVPAEGNTAESRKAGQS